MVAFKSRIIRLAMRTILEGQQGLRVVGEASGGDEVPPLVERFRPDVVVMDYWLGRLSSIEVTRRIVEGGYSTRVLILSLHGPHEHAADVLRVGASGYLTEDSSMEDLVAAVEVVRRGESYLPPSIAHQVVQALGRASDGNGSRLARLTAREREVLQRLAEGASTKQLAADLGVSVRTAESHRAAVMRKLELHGVSDLVRLAIREGLISA